jgi:hypothetical protein
MAEFGVAVAWVKPKQLEKFLKEWSVLGEPSWLFLQQDANQEGGAVTKNKAMRRAIDAGSEVVVVLDDDCYPPAEPYRAYPMGLEEFSRLHAAALAPQPVRIFEVVTNPPSRGTPYENLDIAMPVAASMGFWTEIGDYCAPRQLAFGPTHPMSFRCEPVFWRYFPLCAMNYAFRPSWEPWCYLVEGAGRFDDIWMGWLWQRAAYEQGYCFNLAGPMVRHVRQSNVWKNLAAEAKHLEENEVLWKAIAMSSKTDYTSLRKLLPC